MNEIEVIRSIPKDLNIKHACFDHDGTLSTLREGWIDIMANMMAECILGGKNHEDSRCPTIYKCCLDYINRTKGTQTLVQMGGLIEIIKDFKYIDEKDILSIYEYKDICNDRVRKVVESRISKLNRGELECFDLQIKNACRFLQALGGYEVRLYLFSGNDDKDVQKEVSELRYKHLFHGGVWGSGNINTEIKHKILCQLVGEQKIPAHEIVVFGDGPIEIRAAKRLGILAVGVASNETRRYGLNEEKRKTLINVGADIIIPDYSQMNSLLKVLGVKE